MSSGGSDCARRVLDARAEELRRRNDDQVGLFEESFVIFGLRGYRFAVPLERMRRTVYLQQITEIPGASSYLMGVLAVDGHIVTLLDLADFLGLKWGGESDVIGAVVIEAGGRQLALAADQFLGTVEIGQADMAEMPGDERPLARLLMVRDAKVPVLDVPALLADPRLTPQG